MEMTATPLPLHEKRTMRLAIFTLILPILISSVLEMLVGFVSMALIGDLGAVAIGAMGLSQRVRGIIWSVFKGIGIGLQVVVAQATGSEDSGRAKSAIAQTIITIAILAVAFVATILIFPAQWLSIFNPKGSLLATAIEVLRVIALGLPFLGIVIVVSGGLQGKGDAVTPLIINGLMNVLNITLGIWFVRGGLGLEAMGLMGAAYAMVVSQGLAAVVGIAMLLHPKGYLAGFGLMRFFKCLTQLTKTIYSLGFPSVLESLFWNVSSIFLSRFILSYGNDAFAAFQLGFQAESLAFMPAVGFQVAATAFVGRYLSAGDAIRARAYFREITLWALGVSVFGSFILIFMPKLILGFMTKDPTLIAIATLYMLLCGIAQAPQNVAGVIGGALRGAGYTNLPMITSGIAIYGVRIPLAFMAVVFNWPIVVIFMAIAIDMVIRLLLNGYFYRKQNIYKKPKIV